MKIFNPTLQKELVEELNRLEDRYFTFDKPIPFKTGLTLYPVMLQDYNQFVNASTCLTLNKNETMEGLMQSNLEFLISKMEEENIGVIYSKYASRLFEIIFHVQNGMRCNKCGKIIPFEEFIPMLHRDKDNIKCPECGSYDLEEVIRYQVNPKTKKREMVIMGVKINSGEFDRLRQIVMYQNFPDYRDDSWVHPEVREDQRLKNEILSKSRGGPVSASLERKIVCVSAKSNYKIEELYNLTMRKFIMLLGVIDDAITYETSRIGLMSGMVSSKEPLEHWIYKHEKGMYDDAVSMDSYMNQLSGAAATTIKK